MEIMKTRIFAASGSVFDEELVIKGTVNGITFTSHEFTGTMDSAKFWDDLATLAKKMHKYIILKYK